MVALPSLETVAVVAENVALLAPCATRTDAGTVRAGFPLVNVTVAPGTGAAFARVTVQRLEAFGPRLAGLQTSEVNTAEAARLTVVLVELPL